jgi:glucose uptake protein
MDDLMHAGKRQWLYGFGAGVIFNISYMLLMAAISVAGMAVAFPVALGFALLVGILMSQLGQRTANPIYLALGCVLVLVAIIADGIAYKSWVAGRRAEMLAAAPKKKIRGPGAVKGLVLAVISGILMAMFYPLLDKARVEEIGVGPYSLMLLFAGGAFLSTFVYSLFFMNLPVEGEPLEVSEYFKVRPMSHLFGLVGGALVTTGILATFVATSTAPEARLDRPALFALSQGGALIAALCGLVVWKEFQQGGRATAFLTLLLFASGLAFVSLAFRV